MWKKIKEWIREVLFPRQNLGMKKKAKSKKDGVC